MNHIATLLALAVGILLCALAFHLVFDVGGPAGWAAALALLALNLRLILWGTT